MTGPRDDARLDATNDWNDDFQRRADEQAAHEEDSMPEARYDSEIVAERIRLSVQLLEGMAKAAREHVRTCERSHQVKHRLFEVAAGHFETAAAEIKKGTEALEETL